MNDTPHFAVGDVSSTSDQQPPADVASPEAITARADARLLKRVRYLQAELDGKIALIAQLSSDAAAQHQAIADANARIKTLQGERDAALAEAQYEQKMFAQTITALQSAKSGEFSHIVDALQRARVQ